MVIFGFLNNPTQVQIKNKKRWMVFTFFVIIAAPYLMWIGFIDKLLKVLLEFCYTKIEGNFHEVITF